MLGITLYALLVLCALFAHVDAAMSRHKSVSSHLNRDKRYTPYPAASGERKMKKSSDSSLNEMARSSSTGNHGSSSSDLRKLFGTSPSAASIHMIVPERSSASSLVRYPRPGSVLAGSPAPPGVSRGPPEEHLSAMVPFDEEDDDLETDLDSSMRDMQVADINTDKRPVSPSNQSPLLLPFLSGDKQEFPGRIPLLEQGVLEWLVKGAFFELNYQMPPLSRQEKTDPNPYENTERLGDTIHTSDQLADLRVSIDKFSQWMMNVDPISWKRLLAFKNLMTQYVLYHDHFTQATIHHASLGVDVFSLHLSIPLITMFADLSLVKQIATDVKWVMEQGIVDPILKIAAQFVIKESYHEAGNKREYSQLFPRELKKVQVSLAKAEPGSDVLRSMEEIANHPQATKNLISADFGVSFVTGLTGAVNLFSRFVPGSKRLLRDSRVSIALNGAGLVLQCVKMALDPQSLTKDQTMLMTLTIKAVDFLDSSRQLLQSSDEDEVEDKDDERPGR